MLRTDSMAVTWLRKMKDLKSKLTRWSCLLDEFSFTIEHCAGKDNELADALFRYSAPDAPIPGEPDLDRMMIPVREKAPTIEHSRPAFNALERIPLFDEVSAAQQQDPAVILEIIKWREICAKEPRSDRGEDFAQKHKAGGTRILEETSNPRHMVSTSSNQRRAQSTLGVPRRPLCWALGMRRNSARDTIKVLLAKNEKKCQKICKRLPYLYLLRTSALRYKRFNATTRSIKALGNVSARFNGSLPTIIHWKKIVIGGN